MSQGKTIVSVRYFRIHGGKRFYAKPEYHYYADIPLNVGDVVKAPTAGGYKKARVYKVDVPESKVGERIHLKTIDSLHELNESEV